MNKQFFLLLVVCCWFLEVSAQPLKPEDPQFVENYKKFRKFVDPLASYNLYLVTNGADSKMLINDLAPEMKEAYHFLRRKSTVKREADFNVAAIVKHFSVGSPYSQVGTETSTRDVTVRNYRLIQPYYLSINLLVYSNGLMIEFPLCDEKMFEKSLPFSTRDVKPVPETIVVIPPGRNGEPSRVENLTKAIAGNGVPPLDYNRSYSDALSKMQITKLDMKLALQQLLQQYKNHYVDRVD